MIMGLLNHRMQTSIRPFVELIRNLEKNYIFSKHFQKKVMDDPSQKSMQGMAMPLAICNQILVQIRPSVQELSFTKQNAFFKTFSENQKSMQVLAIPLAICYQVLVQIRPFIQELSCLKKTGIFQKKSKKKKVWTATPKNQCRSWPYP